MAIVAGCAPALPGGITGSTQPANVVTASAPQTPTMTEPAMARKTEPAASATLRGAPEIAVPPSPPETASPTPELPALEQALKDWVDGEVFIDALKSKFQAEGGGRTLDFGPDPFIQQPYQDQYFYLGRILGAAEIDGHYVVFMGFGGKFNDDTEMKENYFVPFVYGSSSDSRVISTITNTNIDSIWGVTLDDLNTYAHEVYGKIQDGTYRDKMVKFLQPISRAAFLGTLYPQRFPNLLERVDSQTAVSRSLYSFSNAALRTDWRTMAMPENLVGIINTVPTSVNDLPMIIEQQVVIPQTNTRNGRSSRLAASDE
jgi:hypothetical protein